jgi:hypothetical protein
MNTFNNILSIILGLLIVNILWTSFNNQHTILTR